MKRFAWIALAAVALAGCSGGDMEGGRPLVVFSQANSQDPWRQVFDAEMNAAAEEHADEFRFAMLEAQDKADLQISQVESLLLKNPVALLISPATEALQSICERAYDRGIPVILLDRGLPGDKYTTLIGGDNVEIGRRAAEYIAEKLGGGGTVLVIKGLAGATPTKDRHDGAMQVWAESYPGIEVIEGDHCDYQRVKARNYMEIFLQGGRQFDAVYAHNDEMAIGAWQAIEAQGTGDKIIVGIDACQREVIGMILDGKLTATLVYPHPARRGIEIASQLLKGESDVPKKIVLDTTVIDITNAENFLADNPNLAK